jgi:hypothetical protein
MTVPDVPAGQACKRMKSATDSDHSLFEEPVPSAATEALQEVLNMSTEGDLLQDISEDSYLPFIQV